MIFMLGKSSLPDSIWGFVYRQAVVGLGTHLKFRGGARSRRRKSREKRLHGTYDVWYPVKWTTDSG